MMQLSKLLALYACACHWLWKCSYSLIIT